MTAAMDVVLVVIKDTDKCQCTQPIFLHDENQWEPGWKCDYCVELDRRVEDFAKGRKVEYLSLMDLYNGLVSKLNQRDDDLPF